MDIEIRLKLARKLKKLRREYRLTQQKLSELSGVDYKHIQRLEGKKPSGATIDTLKKLAKAFDIPISQLLDFK